MFFWTKFLGGENILVEKNKLDKIGVDRISFNNFKILNFDELDNKEIISKSGRIIEKFETSDDFFTLRYSTTSNTDNEIFINSVLTFNAAKYIYGHNVYNSTLEDLKISIMKIIEKLKELGVQADFSEARIKELEINITFEQSFKEFSEVMTFIGRANYKKSIAISSFLKTNTFPEITKNRSLYINSKTPILKKENLGKIIKFYDKTFDMKINQNMELDKSLTRLEVLLGREYYKKTMEKNGYDNKLTTLLTNDFLKKIFTDSIEKEIVIKPRQYLDELKKSLADDFNNFRRNEQVKRKERERYKLQGKEIPELYREERGVFKYLEKNSWIFDYRFLYEIINEQISSRHKKDFERQIKKYMNINNLELYEKFIKKIFGRFF